MLPCQIAMPGKTPVAPMTVRAFARWHGVSHTAVQRRLAAGALPTAAKKIRRRWMILDAERAVAEWQAHTRPRVAALGGSNGATQPSELARSTQRERENRAKLLELEYERKSGALVSREQVIL